MAREQIRYIMFDFDGTIVDSMTFLENNAVFLLMEYYGYSRTEATLHYRETTGLPFIQQMEIIAPDKQKLNSEIVKIEVMDLRDSTYYALIHVKAEGKEIAIDSRPSDAIAVALGTGAPIYVTEEVLSKAKTISSDQLEEWLESFDPEDFRYKA